MNTPSKEALDAAENVQDYWGFPRRDRATIIDRHIEPLRQRAEQAEQKARDWETAANLYQLDFQTEAARAEQAEARVAELEATCAELVTDGNAVTLAANLAKQSARVANHRRLLAWFIEQFRGESGAGESHWEQYPEYREALRLIEHNPT